LAPSSQRLNRPPVFPGRSSLSGDYRLLPAEGEARPGERLPPARDFAAVLAVNTNSLLWALRQLRDEGLLDFRRGRGITVAAHPITGPSSRQREIWCF
jgi:GntR family transcriptional regulator